MKVLNFFLIIFFGFFLILLFGSFFFSLSFLISPIIFFLLFSFLYNITEKEEKLGGFFLAIFLGLCVDILVLKTPVGFFSLLFFLFMYFVKVIVKKYVAISFFA
jgi:hypothetical protein